jgi:hypothetical protein
MLRRIFLGLLLAAAAACATAPSASSPQGEFFAAVRALCGQSFSGRVVSTDPVDAGFASSDLRVEGAACTSDEVRLRFHVGDGSPEDMTNYGGLAVEGSGSRRRQAFPADAESQALFLANDRAVSVDNVWGMEIHPGRLFAYELRREGRFFRVEFDLTRPVG